MTGHRGYNAYFESWTPPLMEDETDISNLNELFVQETLDPRIESVMPILSKLHKKVAEMKEVGALAEWADSLTETPGAETLAHDDSNEESNLKDLDLDESDTQSSNSGAIPESAEDNPVASAITRRILMQRSDLLKKYGPVAITQAIDDVADFIGDVDEIGSSDVSGWIKQIEQSLGGSNLEEALDPEKKQRLNDLIDRYTDATDPEYMGDDDYEDIIAQIRVEFGDKTADSIESGPSMHFPRPGHSMGHDDLEFRQMRKNMSPNRITKLGKLHKQDNDAMKRDLKDKLGVEEGILDTVKKVGSKVFDKLGGGSEEDLLKDLQKKAGIPSHAQHGKPAMAQPKDKEEMAEGEFAGDYATGEAGQWRNKGPKANKPATIGDLVGEGQEDLDVIKRLLGK
jgi:hypothetical protein